MWEVLKNMDIAKSTMASLGLMLGSIKPKLNGEDNMHQVIAWIEDSNKYKTPPLTNNSYYKLLKITVLLYYFAPLSIAYKRLTNRTRGLLARAAGCNIYFISKKKKDILFLYYNDRMFHKDIDDTIAYIDTKLASREALG